MRFAARDLPDGHVEITLPDGSTVSTLDADVDERVSAALDHPVRLERLHDAADLDHYRRGAPEGDPLTEIRAVMGREGDEPLPDFSVFPPTIGEFESPPGTYYDAWPLAGHDAGGTGRPRRCGARLDRRHPSLPSVDRDRQRCRRHAAEHARPPGIRLEGAHGDHRHGQRSSSSIRAPAV